MLLRAIIWCPVRPTFTIITPSLPFPSSPNCCPSSFNHYQWYLTRHWNHHHDRSITIVVSSLFAVSARIDDIASQAWQCCDVIRWADSVRRYCRLMVAEWLNPQLGGRQCQWTGKQTVALSNNTNGVYFNEQLAGSRLIIFWSTDTSVRCQRWWWKLCFQCDGFSKHGRQFSWQNGKARVDLFRNLWIVYLSFHFVSCSSELCLFWNRIFLVTAWPWSCDKIALDKGTYKSSRLEDKICLSNIYYSNIIKMPKYLQKNKRGTYLE